MAARGSGHVLVTSRNPVWRGLAGPLAVDVLARKQAVAFLARRTGREDPGTLDALAEVLGDLPLALEQASAYIEETVTPIGEYVSLFTERASELFGLGQPSNTEQTIATIWTLSLERIRSDMPAAQDLLTLCAFLAPDDIPRPMLAEHSEQLPERLREAVADPLRLQQAIGGLRRYSMITATEDSLSVHRLVQAVVRNDVDRNDVDHDQANQWAVAALEVINAAFPGRGHQFNNWPACARLLPHALAVVRHADEFAGESAMMAALLDKTGLYLWGRAEPTQAQPLLERGLAIRKARLGDDHPDTATSLNHLARALHAQGDLNTARSLLERALTIREACLGKDHPDTAWSLNDLAVVLNTEGDLGRARTLHEQALAIREARRGKDHPTTAISLSNLASVLQAQGDLDRARTLLERGLAIREAHLGKDHLDTVSNLYKLGVVLAELGRLPAARYALNRALAIYRRRLGPNHSSTIACRRMLAALGSAQGPRGRR